MTRRFTGWHMLAILVAFFGVVIAVNTYMAMEATRTFGGVVVENSYVASQEFNHWLNEAAAQRARGWALTATTEDGHPVVTAAQHGNAAAGVRITGFAEHPLGREHDIALTFHETAPGRYTADTALPGGRWRLHVRLSSTSGTADFIEEVHA